MSKFNIKSRSEPAITKKEAIVSKVMKDIFAGRYKPGDKLPSEREIAAEMKIGKTVVHSAFEELAAMGLIEIKPNSGAIAADYMKTGNIEILNSIVKLKGNELSRELTVAILDLRLAIEGMALKALSRSRSDKDIEHLRTITRDLEDKAYILSEEELAEEFFCWHREICILSGKSILTLFMNTMHDVSIAFWINYLRMYDREFAIKRLEQFIDLIEAGNSQKVYDLLASGIEEYLSKLKQ